jgi:hypothetical protein
MLERGLPSPNHADAAVLSTVSAGAVPRRPQAEKKTEPVTADLMTKVM